MHSTVSSINLSLSLIIRLCLIDSAHPASQPTATVLEMSKGKFSYKVQSKPQVSKGSRVPREGISRHKEAATLLRRSSSVSSPPGESSPSLFSQEELLLLLLLICSCAYVSHSGGSRSRQRTLFIFFLLRYRRSPRMLSCIYIRHRWGRTTLTESRRLYLTFIPFFFFLKKRPLYWSVQRVCRRACVELKRWGLQSVQRKQEVLTSDVSVVSTSCLYV